MAKYLLLYHSSPGDEDPDHNHTFEAPDDEEAKRIAQGYGRQGDSRTLYREVSGIKRK